MMIRNQCKCVMERIFTRRRIRILMTDALRYGYHREMDFIGDWGEGAITEIAVPEQQTHQYIPAAVVEGEGDNRICLWI